MQAGEVGDEEDEDEDEDEEDKASLCRAKILSALVYVLEHKCIAIQIVLPQQRSVRRYVCAIGLSNVHELGQKEGKVCFEKIHLT